MVRTGMVAVSLGFGLGAQLSAQIPCAGVFPEVRSISPHNPESFPSFFFPDDPPPPTVDSPESSRTPQLISLDQAIRSSLTTTDVVRVLSGSIAVNSGVSVYDPAIASTRIDREQARFDPVIDTRHDFLRSELPFASFDPLNPNRAFFDGNRSDNYDMTFGLSKRSMTGAIAEMRINANRDDERAARLPLLNPLSRSSAAFSLSQPLLQGAGTEVNRVPIVLARIDTESSYFRLKDSTQESVRQTIQAYWNLIAARTQLWAVDQQVQQAEFAFRLEEARKRIGISDQAALAQTRLALADFRASRVSAIGAVLDREAGLRAILGISPSGEIELVPSTPPTKEKYDFDWQKLIELAEQNRPDLIELKLVLEADYQWLVLAKNNTLPQLDANLLYRWNGLEGELPIGDTIRTEPGAYTDWRLGVNFSVPLGLRESRAALRERELILARDRANINQAVQTVVQELAATIRQLDQQYAQYQAFRETRQAATDNLRAQMAGYQTERIEFINVLQAISNWGSAVSGEAAALMTYNGTLATLELLTGTILEAHGVRFYEERYKSLGPLGRWAHCRDYPRDMRPAANEDRYVPGNEPSEKVFDLQTPESMRPPRDPADPGILRVPSNPEPALERLPPIAPEGQ